jgi:hypothetical protein
MDRATVGTAPRSDALPAVEIPGVGTVSLAALDELRALRDRERASSGRLAALAAELDGQAEDHLAAGGAHLAPRRAWWRPPAEVEPWLAEADRLVARIAALDERAARLGPTRPASPGGPLARLRAGRSDEPIGRDRDRAAAQLRTALVTIARMGAAAGVDVPDVEPLLEAAAELQARAQQLRVELAVVSSRLGDMDREIHLREQAERVMRFDSLHMVAYFTMYGMPAVQSPFELEAGEVAYLATEASLGRMPAGSRYTSRGAGFTPSVMHTGLRHWVGSFRDRAAPAGALDRADPGTFLLSSQRLAFIGRRESVAVALDAVMDIDVYDDALAVVHLGREGPLFLAMPSPRQLAFHLNWALRSGFPR